MHIGFFLVNLLLFFAAEKNLLHKELRTFLRMYQTKCGNKNMNGRLNTDFYLKKIYTTLKKL